jgi:hypothetical protein
MAFQARLDHSTRMVVIDCSNDNPPLFISNPKIKIGGKSAVNADITEDAIGDYDEVDIASDDQKLDPTVPQYVHNYMPTNSTILGHRFWCPQARRSESALCFFFEATFQPSVSF